LPQTMFAATLSRSSLASPSNQLDIGDEFEGLALPISKFEF